MSICSFAPLILRKSSNLRCYTLMIKINMKSLSIDMSNQTFNDTAMGCVGERDLENCVRGIFLDPGDELSMSLTGAPEVFPGGEAGGLPGEPPEGPPPLWPPPLPADGLIDARVFFILEMIINCGLINIISVLGAVGRWHIFFSRLK